MSTVILIYEHSAGFTLLGVFTETGAYLFAQAHPCKELTGIRHKVNEEDDGEVIDLRTLVPVLRFM
jgi:hypothetical protein